MCQIAWRPDALEYYDSISPTAHRSLPQLTWAIPVDIVELVATLEAYSNQILSTTTLRLCHRYGGHALPRLPQEALDQIIAEAQIVEKARVRSFWDLKFACFQGYCKEVDHYEDQIGGIWQDLYGACCHEDEFCDCDHDYDQALNPANFSEEEKKRMIEDYVVDVLDGAESYHVHQDNQHEWVNQLCLCSKDSPLAPSKFSNLNQTLKAHFGLEIAVLHEATSLNLAKFLPESRYELDDSYYTSCYLMMPLDRQKHRTAKGCTAAGKHKHFLNVDNHLAFCQIIDLSELGITEKEKLRFARIMRILDLKPAFHITELETLIDPSTQDSELWEICNAQLKDCPRPTYASTETKKILLMKYLEKKGRELAQESWPKLMQIAASDVTCPSQ